ncbi:polysaccharide deacetylase family protein [Nostocaceae cyanobacterium CENA369]|uniref:Polysaccharide deacetylase family protein n=1 Tax=Dendronalium phyllosphericum CENA369 TaxID=1725256 RepID=A0A8J7I2M0_9NOST|nr:polysaccharide deacetylase family protein [Dendronalium phyllosphericum]MBH8574889.1 polysaccharide deacetylase family protein [Dendronalium phyllosphericum CENA369]
MTENHEQNFVNYSKPKGFYLSLVLGFVMFFSIINFQYTTPIIPILGFHGILDTKSNLSNYYVGDMQYSKQDMEKLLEQLIINNYWFLTTQDLYNFFLTRSQKIPYEYQKKKPVMISFDDGYKTVYTNLLPVLDKLEKKYTKKIKVVLFINPGTLALKGSRNSTHLGCQELREGLKKGFYDIQSHGLNHKDLTQLNRRELIKEILQSRTELRKCTQDLDPDQKVASHFAYPYGAYNKQVESYVSKYYLSSYLYNDELLNYGCFKNYYEIPRLMVNRQKSAKQLLEIAETLSTVSKQKLSQNKC